jgi:hypothetical protein
MSGWPNIKQYVCASIMVESRENQANRMKQKRRRFFSRGFLLCYFPSGFPWLVGWLVGCCITGFAHWVFLRSLSYSTVNVKWFFVLGDKQIAHNVQAMMIYLRGLIGRTCRWLQMATSLPSRRRVLFTSYFYAVFKCTIVCARCPIA